MNKETKKFKELLEEMEEVSGNKPFVMCADDLKPGQGYMLDEENDIEIICGMNEFLHKTFDGLVDTMFSLIIDLMVKSYHLGIEENFDDIKKEIMKSFEIEAEKIQL